MSASHTSSLDRRVGALINRNVSREISNFLCARNFVCVCLSRRTHNDFVGALDAEFGGKRE